MVYVERILTIFALNIWNIKKIIIIYVVQGKCIIVYVIPEIKFYCVKIHNKS